MNELCRQIIGWRIILVFFFLVLWILNKLAWQAVLLYLYENSNIWSLGIRTSTDCRMSVQVGVDSKGIETVLRRLIGPYGLFKDIIRGTISVKDILRPLTQNNMDDIQRKIREITAKVE